MKYQNMFQVNFRDQVILNGLVTQRFMHDIKHLYDDVAEREAHTLTYELCTRILLF